MMLMTKFGKFKLRFFATIKLSVIMSLLSMASTLTPHWIRYTDPETSQPHLAGIWVSCPANSGSCVFLNGIVDKWHSCWSHATRLFVGIGACGNIICALLFIAVMWYKMSKPKPPQSCGENGTTEGKPLTTPTKSWKSSRTHIIINLMEWANWILAISFILMMVGFCIFLSSKCTMSLWFHCLAMCFAIVTSNWLTRTFATIYFQNTRTAIKNGGENTISQSKLVEYTNNAANTATEEEKQALKAFENGTVTSTENTQTCIEMQKLPNETGGSKEALIKEPAKTEQVVVELKAAASNSNINSQPGDAPVVSMSASNKALNKC